MILKIFCTVGNTISNNLHNSLYTKVKRKVDKWENTNMNTIEDEIFVLH